VCVCVCARAGVREYTWVRWYVCFVQPIAKCLGTRMFAYAWERTSLCVGVKACLKMDG